MKKSSLIALIGVGLLIFSNLFFFIANIFGAWQYDWYQIIGKASNVLSIVAWILVGQFFLTLYKKSK